MSNSTIIEFLRSLGRLFDCQKPSGEFIQIKTEGIKIRGIINMVKLEFGQKVTFTAGDFKDRHGNPAEIQAGSAQWSVGAVDTEGQAIQDIGVDFILQVNPDNELEATISAGNQQVTGLVTFRADGDPDADEEAPIVATASIIVDAPNVVAMSLTNTDPVDV